MPDDSTPFDMRGVDLGHVNGGCSFERFLEFYDLHEPALQRIAEIVHEADIGGDRFTRRKLLYDGLYGYLL